MERLHQTVGIIVRIAAIFIVKKVISYIPNWYFYFSHELSEPEVIVLMILYSAGLIIVAIFLWKYPLYISHKIIPETENKDKFSDVPFEQAQIALLSILGIGIVVLNLSDLFYWYSYLRELKSASDAGYPIETGVYASLYSTILELALGIWLIFGSRGIIQIINKLKYAGVKK